MFNSIHSQKIIKWLLLPKKYVINTEVNLTEEGKEMYGIKSGILSRYTTLN
jgi:hypothetical protein